MLKHTVDHTVHTLYQISLQILSVQAGDAKHDGVIPNVDLSQLKSKDLDALAAVFQRWIKIQERIRKPPEQYF